MEIQLCTYILLKKNRSLRPVRLLISCTFSANEQYFSLIINRSPVLSAMAYQPSEQGIESYCIIKKYFIIYENRVISIKILLYCCYDNV